MQLYDLLPRQDCGQGTLYYVCSSNGFQGCCTVDPCSLPDCPVAEAPDSEPASYVTDTSSLPTSTASINPDNSDPDTTYFNFPTSTSYGYGVSYPTITSTACDLLSCPPESTYAPLPGQSKTADSSNSHKGAIIGAVSAGLVVLIISIFILWKWRQHKRNIVDKRHRHQTNTFPYSEDPRDPDKDPDPREAATPMEGFLLSLTHSTDPEKSVEPEIHWESQIPSQVTAQGEQHIPKTNSIYSNVSNIQSTHSRNYTLYRSRIPGDKNFPLPVELSGDDYSKTQDLIRSPAAAGFGNSPGPTTRSDGRGREDTPTVSSRGAWTEIYELSAEQGPANEYAASASR